MKLWENSTNLFMAFAVLMTTGIINPKFNFINDLSVTPIRTDNELFTSDVSVCAAVLAMLAKDTI